MRTYTRVEHAEIELAHFAPLKERAGALCAPQRASWSTLHPSKSELEHFAPLPSFSQQLRAPASPAATLPILSTLHSLASTHATCGRSRERAQTSSERPSLSVKIPREDGEAEELFREGGDGGSDLAKGPDPVHCMNTLKTESATRANSSTLGQFQRGCDLRPPLEPLLVPLPSALPPPAFLALLRRALGTVILAWIRVSNASERKSTFY